MRRFNWIAGALAWATMSNSALAAPVYLKCVSTALPSGSDSLTEFLKIDGLEFLRWDDGVSMWATFQEASQAPCNKLEAEKINTYCSNTPTQFEYAEYGASRSEEFSRVLIDRTTGEYNQWPYGRRHARVGLCEATQPPKPAAAKF